MKIIKKHIKFNFSKREGAIKYIVIHDTGNPNKGADSLAHFNYFNSKDRNASAHYFIDDKKIIEVIDPLKNRSWHCGDGKGKKGITNDNSIGLEMCINSDSDFNKTFKATVELTKFLMNKYKIPLTNVVRHYDASGKICPFSLIKEKKKGKTWELFKKSLNDNIILYRVCIGSYSNLNNAKIKAKESKGFIVEHLKDKQKYYRVCVGSYSNLDNARKKAKESGGFIVKYVK